MTKTHEYNENLVFSNEETHKALVSHFNQIGNIAKNKKFEWEDEELTENYNITYDFCEWFPSSKEWTLEDYDFWKYEVPENLVNDLMNYANQLKDYVDAFLLAPVGMYKGKTFTAEVHKKDTFPEIVEHMKQVRQNNQMVFLYRVYQKTKRPKEIVEILPGSTTTLPQDLSTGYVVRYGVLN